MDELFETYLQDHYAGAVGGVELARRVEDENKGTELEDRFHLVRVQIEEDHEVLGRLLEQYGVEPSRAKNAGSWVAEKVARLKSNGKVMEYSPLSRVLEVEGLIGAVNMKRALWETLAQRQTNGSAIKAEELIARAEAQLETLEDLHRASVDLAFTD